MRATNIVVYAVILRYGASLSDDGKKNCSDTNQNSSNESKSRLDCVSAF
ncbi:MAG: hypothetical protein KatS3mg083_423 [Candidatus Dojkabacteria bacterium]|nr:MAG: hypothetical protein KatS3mg083_423 [Candidatus Dojkabacteria bacterium]